MTDDAFKGELIALDNELAEREMACALVAALAATDEQARQAALLRMDTVRPGTLQALLAGLELRRTGAVRH